MVSICDNYDFAFLGTTLRQYLRNKFKNCSQNIMIYGVAKERGEFIESNLQDVVDKLREKNYTAEVRTIPHYLQCGVYYPDELLRRGLITLGLPRVLRENADKQPKAIDEIIDIFKEAAGISEE